MVENLTALIEAARQGDADATDSLFAQVYTELKRLAHLQLARNARGHAALLTLNTTALVHEAYMKLAGHGDGAVDGREHFFSLAARAMRQIVIDHARAQLTEKRGVGQYDAVRLDDALEQPGSELSPEKVLRLDEALGRFEREEPRLAALVELRFFGGLSVEQIAALQQVSERTLNRDWRRAKVHLFLALGPG